MSSDRILNIIEDLQEKLKNQRPIHMNINNYNNNFHNFNNNINKRQLEEIFEQNNNVKDNNNFNYQNNLNEDYIRKLIKNEFSELILPYHQDMFSRINVLDLKVNNLTNKINNNIQENKLDKFNINTNKNINNNADNNVEYINKITEMEYKISEIELFFKSWKDILKKNELNPSTNMSKNNKEFELKFMQLESKINNELNKFYNIMNEEINNIKKNLNQIKINETEINKLEGEIKNIKIDFSYMNKDISDIKDLFNLQIKKDLININQKQGTLINDINSLKYNFENIKIINNDNNYKEFSDKIKNQINNNLSNNNNIQLKTSKINYVEEIKVNDEIKNNKDNNTGNKNNFNDNENDDE